MSTIQTPYPPASAHAAPAEAPSGPWWKYGHMWMVVGGPLVVVVAAFVTLWLAIRTPDPVYTDADDIRVRSAATMQRADEHDGPSMAPAMQGRNHAATGGVTRPTVHGPKPGTHP
ncbi:nitrogen fixation protein FixH [Ottowia flava]|uniref:Nitrogen fixation protein FixH n=1 Tax=Ottowia flava TaxID=2675430 RepID=A0ABW4KTB0_9BURK|nr:nitrogen fixation protein FixH [Ottowia sp. GY511]